MALQIFGTKKCSETRKAERFFKERGMKYHFIDLTEKGISPGELRAVMKAVGRDALIDVEGALYGKKGLAYLDFDPEEEILKDPLLLKTPIIRDASRVVIGADPKVLDSFIQR
jgi:arsenate reductase (glutaredoxin)